MGKKIKAIINFTKKVGRHPVVTAFACGMAGVAGKKLGSKLFENFESKEAESIYGATDVTCSRLAGREYRYSFSVKEEHRFTSWYITANSERRLDEEEFDDIASSKSGTEAIRAMLNAGMTIVSVV